MLVVNIPNNIAGTSVARLGSKSLLLCLGCLLMMEMAAAQVLGFAWTVRESVQRDIAKWPIER